MAECAVTLCVKSVPVRELTGHGAATVSHNQIMSKELDAGADQPVRIYPFSKLDWIGVSQLRTICLPKRFFE
jgi:hypothetical protein